MYRTLLFIVILIFICSPLASYPLFAATSDILINEIAASENSDHEWIELYNKGTEPIDLTGWKFFESDTNHGLSAFRGDMIIEPGEYAVIADVAANTAADYPAFTGTLIDSAWTTLTEAGESIALKDATGSIVEEFSYISAPSHSLERINGTIADYTANNWKEHASGNTIGALNSASTPAAPPPETPIEPSDPVVPPQPAPNPAPIPAPVAAEPETPRPRIYSRGDMYINEWISDPDDDTTEWIELYNPQGTDISLAGWTIEDGSKTKTTLSGTIGASANNRFFIVENPKGKLNNTGDLIVLKDPNGIIIDDVAYGNWDDGNTLNNAPSPKDSLSSARTRDGAHTYNNAFDFHITTVPTKGSSNIILNPDTPAESTALPFIKDIVISELLPDPIGIDTKAEFIELYNNGTTNVDLLGWEIVNASGRKYIVDKKQLTNTIITPKGYFLLERPVTGLALKNTGGDEIKIYQPNGEKPNAIAGYTDKTTQGHSYAWFGDQGYSWTTAPTPGMQNTKVLANQPPEPDMEIPSTGAVLEELIFDASDTTDPEQDPLTYAWDFGDKQKGDGIQLGHHYTKAGRYKVTLTVKDRTNEKTITKTIVIQDAAQSTAPDPLTKLPTETISQSVAGISPIVINEVAPNPKGKDTNEFIELGNISNIPVDVSGWRVTYQLGKKSFTFPANSHIDPHTFLLLTPQNHKIQLRNAADTITLYHSNGDFLDVLSYEDAPEAQSLARTPEGDYMWSYHVTPGNHNASIVSNMTDSALSGPQSTLASTKVSTTPSSSKKAAASSILQTTLEQARELPLNTRVRVQGTVASLPGALGANIFYLAGSGMQIYVTKNEMPTLLIGDTVQLTGTRTQISDEARIKVGKEDTIRFMSHGKPPVPSPIAITDIGEEYEGSLVTIKGEVVKTQWPSIYIDDGSDEARVYIKTSTGIARIKVEKGSTLQATGIVSQTTSGYRILPRTNNDLIFSTTQIAPTEDENTQNNTTLSLSSSDKPIPLIQIGVVSLFGIVFLASSMYIQRRTPKQ